MGSINIAEILQSFWDNKDIRPIYIQALKITDEARFPEEYEIFKTSWHGLDKQKYELALKTLIESGWEEPNQLKK